MSGPAGGTPARRRRAARYRQPGRTRTGRASRRTRAARLRRSALRLGELELAEQLDRELEGDVLVDHAERLDALDAAPAEPVAHTVDEPLGGRRPGRDADHLDAVEPRLVDLCLIVDQMPRDPSGARDLDQAVRVGGIARADDEQEVDLREHLLDRPLAVGGRIA